MTTDQQFWWNCWVQFATAIGTVGAVLLALFGNWLRITVAPPKLKIRLKDEHPPKIPVQLRKQGESTHTNAVGEVTESLGRWYHVRVCNERRWSPANETQLLLLRVEGPDASGRPATLWTGAVPIAWAHSAMPVGRKVGPELDCDICSVVRANFLQLHALVTPLSIKGVRTQKCQMFLTLQARCVEADSNVLRLEITWDGEWADDTAEMARHLIVREAAPYCAG